MSTAKKMSTIISAKKRWNDQRGGGGISRWRMCCSCLKCRRFLERDSNLSGRDYLVVLDGSPFFVCCPQRKTLYFWEALSERLLLAHAVYVCSKKSITKRPTCDTSLQTYMPTLCLQRGNPVSPHIFFTISSALRRHWHTEHCWRVIERSVWQFCGSCVH